MRGSDFKNPIFDPTFDGSIRGPDFGPYGFRFGSSKNSSKLSTVESGRSLGVKADDPGKYESRRSRRQWTIFGSKQTILGESRMSPLP